MTSVARKRTASTVFKHVSRRYYWDKVPKLATAYINGEYVENGTKPLEVRREPLFGTFASFSSENRSNDRRDSIFMDVSRLGVSRFKHRP